jgi:hypothetical protein
MFTAASLRGWYIRKALDYFVTIISMADSPQANRMDENADAHEKAADTDREAAKESRDAAEKAEEADEATEA